MVMMSVQISGLRVVRGGREVIPDLDAAIPSGQITGLLGPSGCGKTTLLRAIVGVQVIAGGLVTVLEEAAGSASLRRRVAYQTQAPSVYSDLSVRENLEFFAAVLGLAGHAVDDALETVGMTESEQALTGRLSGGQRSRVSLAVALLAKPEIMVLDEPTVGLDPVLRKQLWGTFRELADAGATLIVSSHVMDEAMHCDRLLLMRDGRLIADDEPDALMRRTNTADIESAFLTLVDDDAAA
ncbi:MAG TPA: ABC transporter ATP-binding protein [Nocardioidaceae bacterium]|nr:ABC transporter ATP-binding protein [Nocardioidaceae bacterium]